MTGSKDLNVTGPDFAVMLRQRRSELDLTRTELARRVGCSPDTIKKLETGDRRPSKDLAELLAEHLQIDRDAREGFIALARARATLVGDLAPTNLPAPLNSFIGRENETAYIDSLLLEGEARLLTLVGPPGVGKSRLALHVSERLRRAFPDGVWYVPLTTVEEPQQVLLLIAKTLGIIDDGYGAPLDWLTATLRNRHLLLVLDNFEQVPDAAPLITALLADCAHVTAFITSRTSLEVYGEHQFVLSPLPVPPPALWETPAKLETYEAVQLFVARIHAHNPTFQLSVENSAAIAELCARLDGIPLAIELAAGLAHAEAPHLLLEDVKREGRLSLLTTTQRDRTARQQTLREAIAWSVRRLAPTDLRLFARLGVFQGTFDLDAAYAVAGGMDQEAAMDKNDFKLRLQALTSSHLVQLQTDMATPRFRLLEMVREFAMELLHTAGETHKAQHRHAQHFAQVAYAIDPARAAGNLRAWRDQLRPDYLNVNAALHFALSINHVEQALHLAGGLGQFWYLEGSWQEGVKWLAQALTLPGGSPAARARVNTELGILYSALGRYPEAELHLTRAREEATKADDLHAAAWILAQLSQVALLQGQSAVTRAYTHERLQIYRRLGDIRYLAGTLEQMGCAAVEEGDYARGIPWLEECQTHWETQGARAGVASVHLIIGMADLAQGESQHALTHFQQAYEEFNAIQHSHGLPWSLRNLGLAHLALGQVAQAQFSLSRSFDRYALLTGKETSSAVVVEAIAGIASRLGQHHLAANLMGAAAVVRQERRLPLTENSRQIYDRLLASSMKALGPDEWARAVAVGATLPWAEAVASARTLLTPRASAPNKNAAPSPKRTRRGMR